jgi:hypothetical protein
MKSVEDAALAAASVFRSLGVPLPEKMPWAGEEARRQFTDLLGRYMPFDLVIDEETADGREVRAARDSVCRGWGAIAGEIRYFATRDGSARASIEGTQIPMEVLRRYAVRREARPVYRPDDKRNPLRLERTLEYFGFTLEHESEAISAFPPEHAPAIRRVLAEAMARFEARHAGVNRNRQEAERVREVYRRSGGRTARLGLADIVAAHEKQLVDVSSLEEFRAAELPVRATEFVTPAELATYMALPSEVELRGRMVPLEYDMEYVQGEPLAVVRLRLPEKIAAGLVEEELPQLDRPVRFAVSRGSRGSIRAGSLDELHELLGRPWMPDEIRAERRTRRSGPERKREGRRRR